MSGNGNARITKCYWQNLGFGYVGNHCKIQICCVFGIIKKLLVTKET